MARSLVLDLPAGARQRGRAHDEQLRDEIREHLEAWRANVNGGDPEGASAYLAAFSTETDFLPAARRWTPALVEEVEGLAEGSGLPFEDVWALQLIDEEWAFAARRRSAPTPTKCSTAALAGDGAERPTVIGQNMDLGAYTDGFQVLLRMQASVDAPVAQVFSLAGVIGLMGVNGAGLGVCVNSLPQLPTAGAGLPVAFVIRGALARRTARDAAAFVEGVRHATNQHYALADPRTVVSLECSAAGVRPFDGQAPGRVLHTNHPLAPGWAEAAGTVGPNTTRRLRSLLARLADPSTRPGAPEVEAALAAFDDPEHPVCRLRPDRPGLINFTTGAMVSVLPADGPVTSRVSFGPPSENPFLPYSLEPALAA